MIDIKEIFDNNVDVAKSVSLWLGDNPDGAELAGAAEYMVEMKVPALSVSPISVPVIWPWVEKSNIKIYSRFDCVAGDDISNLVVNINSVFKQGATGAQLIVKLNDLKRFAESMSAVRDDLFFNKDLSIGLDIFEIWPLDWADVFADLNKLHASSVLLIMSHEDMNTSDFVGRIYSALENWTAQNMELHVMLGTSFIRAEQVYRLVQINRPELIDKLKFFVAY